MSLQIRFAVFKLGTVCFLANCTLIIMDDIDLESTYKIKKIDPEHKDLVHDVSFDFFGKRMATCSSDQSVKVCFI